MEIRVLVWIATGLGLGLVPLLPGTTGAILGTPISFYASRVSVRSQLAIAISLTLVAIPICHGAAREFESEDDPRIVADEFLTFPIATVGLPCAKHPALLCTAFVTSRVLDYVKLPPAAQAQEVHGGVGIVLDDAVSNLYTLGACWLGYAVYCHRARRFGWSTTESSDKSRPM